jgi:hypothetical protein
VPVAWLTCEPVPQPGRLWWELARSCEGSGLVPFLAASARWDWRRPWFAGKDFSDPQDVSGIDDLDPADILRKLWDEEIAAWHGNAEEADDVRGERDQQIGPFSPAFPGLAPAVDQLLEPAQVGEALDQLRWPRRIGLAAGGHSGDVLPALGWTPGNWFDGTLPVAAVLRSWEDRFGARLAEIDMDAFTVLAQRPPRTLAAAQHLAAEMYAFAGEIHIGRRWARTEVSEIAAGLLHVPLWRFWWD